MQAEIVWAMECIRYQASKQLSDTSDKYLFYSHLKLLVYVFYMRFSMCFVEIYEIICHQLSEINSLWKPYILSFHKIQKQAALSPCTHHPLHHTVIHNYPFINLFSVKLKHSYLADLNILKGFFSYSTSLIFENIFI